MKFLLHRSIRTQLLLLVLFSLLPTVAIFIYTSVWLHERASLSTQDSVVRISRSFMYQQQLIVESTRQLLMLLAKVPGVRERNTKVCNKILRDVREKNPVYANLFILNPEGTLFASSVPKAPASYAYRKYYKDVVKTRDLSAGEYVIGTAVDRPVFHFAYPVFDENGVLQAIVVAAIDLEQYEKIFSHSGIPSGSIFTLSDHRGVRLYRHPYNRQHIGMPDTESITKRMSGGSEEGIFAETSNDGVKRIYAYCRYRLKPTANPYLFMSIGIPEKEALSEVRLLLWRDMLLLSVAFIMAMALAWFLGESLIVRRLSRLVEVSDHIREGGHGVQTGLSHEEGGELGKLAEAFDKMSLELQERDVERRQAEELLHKSEEKYRGIFENAIDGIFQTSSEGRILTTNSAYARIHSYNTPEELLDAVENNAQQLYLNPQDRVNYINKLNDEGIVRDYEVERYRKDGSKIWVSITARAVKDEHGNIMYIEGILKNITNQKVLERQLLEAQKMEAIGKLAGGIAHDFNNILAAIMGYTEMTLEEQDETVRDNNLRKVLRSSERAKNLVKQILAYSRHGNHEKAAVDMKYLVSESVQMLRSTLPATIKIKTNVADDAMMVFADATQIQQVIMNLSTNASHAMGENGGILEITMRRVNLPDNDLALGMGMQPGIYVKLSVADSGHGIEQAIMDRIFDPFFTTKDVGEGTGLGLSVVYGIVKRHGGLIKVTSSSGDGATFDIYLPCLEKAGSSGQESPDRIPRGTERIIFVDDDPNLTELGQKVLSSLGYHVTAVTESPEALNIIRNGAYDFDLVITDMTMPDLTGTELAREVIRIRPDIPVILCTGYSEHIDEVKAKEIGIKAFVMKPVTRRRLARIVRGVLDKGISD